jgi:hypothetical protein
MVKVVLNNDKSAHVMVKVVPNDIIVVPNNGKSGAR